MFRVFRFRVCRIEVTLTFLDLRFRSSECATLAVRGRKVYWNRVPSYRVYRFRSFESLIAGFNVNLRFLD